MKQVIQTDKSAAPGGAYSQGWRAGDFIYTAGMGANDPVTGALAGDTIEAQTRQTLDNIKAVLAAAGATLADVVKVTTHLSDLNDFAGYNAVYATYFAEPRPSRTTVGSQLAKGMLIEVDVVAYVRA